MAATAPAETTAANGVTAAARGGWWGVAGSATSAVFAFLLVSLTTRALGAQGAGAVFTGVGVFTILSNTFKLGADTGLVRFVSRDLALDGGRSVTALLRTAVVPVAGAATAAALPLLIFPSIATTLLPDLRPADAVTLVRLFGLFLPFATVGLVLLSATVGHGTVVPFVGVEQVGKPVLRVLIAVPVAYCAPGTLSLAAAWLVPAGVGTVAAWLALRRCQAARGPGPLAVQGAAPWRDFWGFAAPRAVSSVFDISAVWVGVILLSALATGTEAGVYTAIGRVVTAGNLVQLAVRLATAPQISRLLAVDQTAEARQLHRVSTCWIVLFSWPLFALFTGFPRTFLSIFGPEFVSGAPGLVVLCGAAMINVAVGNAQSVLLMAGKSTWHLGITALSFTVQMAVGLLAVPVWGVLGAAMSWSVATIVENLSAAVLIRRRLAFSTVDRGYTIALGIGLAVWVVVVAARVIGGDTPSGLAVGMTFGLCMFGPALWSNRRVLRLTELVGVLRRHAT